MLKKLIAIYIIFLLIGPFVVYSTNKSLYLNPTLNLSFALNFIQRAIALIVFIMMAVQIITASFMDALKRKFGDNISKFHFVQGVIIYSFILVHILSFLLTLTFSRRIIDPFYIFSDFCILCKEKHELFLSLGRFSFWLITLTGITSLLKKHPSLIKNWRLLHYFNYIVFVLVLIHAKFIGSDIASNFYSPVFYLFSLMVFIIMVVNLIRSRTITLR